jgi:hypothetical protein
MSYKSETIQAVLPRINSTFFLPALQREFVWTADQVCALFDSLMRRYPISAFLFWQVPVDGRDDVEAYEFLHSVQSNQNRAKLARMHCQGDMTFVLDGQQRLTALLVGLQGTYHDRKSRSGKGSRMYVTKKLHLDLLHDGRVPDDEGEVYYHFEFFDCAPLYTQGSYWFEVGKILKVEGPDGIGNLIDRQVKFVRDVRPLPSRDVEIVEHNLRRLYDAIWNEEVLSYHTERDVDHERILEIFVRANSGGTDLSKSDLLLATLTLHWGSENAREEINEFVHELNTGLTRKNDLDKDFVMKSCLVLINKPVAYRVSSFTKDTCARIKQNWEEIRSAIRRAVDAANAFGIDGENLTSANALIPIAYFLYLHPKLTLRGESSTEAESAARARVWLLSALLNGVFGASSDSMLTRLREAILKEDRPNGTFPIAALDEAVRASGRQSAASDDALDNILTTTYEDRTCFLALSLLYEERNWGTIQYSTDHLFSQDLLKGKNVPGHIKELRHDFGNLALVTASENSAKQNRPLHEWLGTRSPEYLKRHFIPADPELWHLDQYETFLIERRKLIKARIQEVFAFEPALGFDHPKQKYTTTGR